jgi:hypothetical protein
VQWRLPFIVMDGLVPSIDSGTLAVIPTGISLDLCKIGMPVGMSLISRAAAPPTPRAYQSAQALTGIIQCKEMKPAP